VRLRRSFVELATSPDGRTSRPPNIASAPKLAPDPNEVLCPAHGGLPSCPLSGAAGERAYPTSNSNPPYLDHLPQPKNQPTESEENDEQVNSSNKNPIRAASGAESKSLRVAARGMQ
jgi:hypothetical protein